MPFCTIEPNVGQVPMISQRLRKLASIYSTRKIVAHELEFVDIAGLVPGASKGAGMGNQFLANITNVKVICQVLRCFENTDILHHYSSIDPLRDIEVIQAELILADLELVEKRKLGKHQKEHSKTKFAIVDELRKYLEDGKLALDMRKTFTSDQKLEQMIFDELPLLTTKPILYLCNVDEDNVKNGNEFSNAVKDKVGEENAVVVSASI
eukprot:UN06680